MDNLVEVKRDEVPVSAISDRPFRLLQMVEVYQSVTEKGVSSFILLLKDSDGEKYATTLICRGNYAEHVKKAFHRLQGVPLPVDETPGVAVEVGADGTTYGHYEGDVAEEAKVEIESAGA